MICSDPWTESLSSLLDGLNEKQLIGLILAYLYEEKNKMSKLFSTLLKNGSPLKFTLKRFGIFAWNMPVLNHCVDLHELHELIYILAKITPRPPFMLIQKRCGNWVVYIPQFYFMQICFYEIFQLAALFCIWIKALKKLGECKYIIMNIS